MFRWSVLVTALLVTAPTVWAAFGTQDVDVTAALVHYLVAVPVVAVLFALVRRAVQPSARHQRAARDTQPAGRSPRG